MLLQTPGWLVAAVVLWALHEWAGLPGWIAAGLLLAYIAKDFLLYPFLRRAYEGGGSGGAELAGERGTAIQKLAPRGYVRVRGELWEAELPPGSEPVPEGAPIRVQAARGMRLVVTRDETPQA